jgi:hypothetical protein
MRSLEADREVYQTPLQEQSSLYGLSLLWLPVDRIAAIQIAIAVRKTSTGVIVDNPFGARIFLAPLLDTLPVHFVITERVIACRRVDALTDSVSKLLADLIPAWHRRARHAAPGRTASCSLRVDRYRRQRN